MCKKTAKLYATHVVVHGMLISRAQYDLLNPRPIPGAWERYVDEVQKDQLERKGRPILQEIDD